MHNDHLLISQLVADRRASLVATSNHVHEARRTRRLRRTRTATVTSEQPAAVGRPPTPATPAFANWAASLGAEVELHGTDRVERSIAALVRSARRHDVGWISPTVIEVLADRSAPSAARERALGIVVTELSTQRRSTAAATAATAA